MFFFGEVGRQVLKRMFRPNPPAAFANKGGQDALRLRYRSDLNKEYYQFRALNTC
jgi:hypothetical protein